MTSFTSTALIVYLSTLGVPSSAAVRPAVLTCQQLPANIQVTEQLRPAIATLIAKSATFRRQCDAIAAAPHVRVGMTLTLTPLGTNIRARALARRYAAGAVIVEVQIPHASDYVELIAHELEHVTELVDGVNLSARAIDHPDLVRRRPEDGAFETARARAAGEAAALEVYGPVDPRLTAVGRHLALTGRFVWTMVTWPRLMHGAKRR